MIKHLFNWDSDPDLKELQMEFVESLQTRLEKLAEVESKISTLGLSVELLQTGQIIAHKLAGCAGSYGFPTLTQLAGKLDDYLEDSVEKRTVKEVLDFLALLKDAMTQASQSRLDPIKILGDPRMEKLTSAVESLPD